MAITIWYIYFIKVLFISIFILDCNASDCLNETSKITDGNSSNTLVSPNEVFELGFFTPDGKNNNSRYLGIWYYNQSNPRVVVWVANRNKPLLDYSGFLEIKDGNARVRDTNNLTYWSTDVTSPVHATLCLQDTGNLILNNNRGQRGLQKFWQSFDYPTDTFLPGMDITERNLTSWETNSNPAEGNYMFMLQIQRNTRNNLVILKKGSPHYWESDVTDFDQAPQILFNLFTYNTLLSDSEGYNNTRLVMNFTGQIQFWKWETVTGWSLNWTQPKDKCSLYNVCGNFGSCNINYGLLCKCLPGFTASSPRRWNSGNFSEGCFPKSVSCSRNYSSDEFLRMPMMKISTPKTNQTGSCKTACLQDCTCVAYSCGVANCTGTSNQRCLMWYNELTNLQEEYAEGLIIYIRSTQTDIESTPRDCKPCGTYIIPYPLSSSADCGDSSYLNFHCNEQTGQVNFSTSKGTFKVTSIDPDAKRFSIQLRHGNSCDGRSLDATVLSPNDTLLYSVTNCNVIKQQSLLDAQQSFIEVEMVWKPPSEPACNASSDCHDWPYTTCKAAKGGKMMCVCGSNYHWDGSNLKCTKKEAFPLKIVLLCIAGASAIILICGILFAHFIRKRRSEGAGSVEIKGDDSEGVDVPFFNWGSVLAATNNFSDSNKLGKGGFGAVFEGLLPDGKKIAVKRLSTVSVQGVEEFRTEVVLIAKLQHRNLVRLLGYCVKADEKILIYEYMPNGSLDSCLFGESCSLSLDWKKRFDIILGIARGLLYLHHDSRLRIIHRDLKPSNILLDEELNPKISDFGIARIVGGKDTQGCTSRVVGTYGYMSPEYAYEGLFSVKSDVFSFGVIILETVSGRRNSRMVKYEHGASLLGHAWKMWNEDRQLELINPTLKESCNLSEVLKFIHIGLLCVQEEPNDRPTMSTVFLMLSSENVCLPRPKQPAFVSWKPSSDTASSSGVQVSSLSDPMITVSSVGR